ncbi:MAG: gamma-glutamylcyclotransferase [Candidatus Melainabacteria bacterium]|nr:gamma-glutamylcyclotransferase [Candidatus Melainabacteria bacterium]
MISLLESHNRWRRRPGKDTEKELREALLAMGHEPAEGSQAIVETLERVLANPSHRLAAYGTLRPGESNHHIVSHIRGEWLPGVATGHVREVAGYPSFCFQEGGRGIGVEVLISRELPRYYPDIDCFEGELYVRVLVPVRLEKGGGSIAICNIYEGVERKY